MNIFNASAGSKITFAHPEKGSTYEREKTAKHLKVGETYTINKIYIGGFNTDIYLDEVPDVKFNSVMFDDAA